MKHLRLSMLFSLLFIFSLTAQTEWTGSKITFSKAGFADWTLQENQDRLTNNVWLTRQSTKAIFNIAQETEFQGNANGSVSPLDTEWAFGTIADGVQNLTFTNWVSTFNNGGSPASLIGQDMVLHLITDDIYIDIVFLSWGSSGQGAPFSYERSTSNLSSSIFSDKSKVKIYPNPALDNIRITGLEQETDYSIYNILGQKINSGTISSSEPLQIEDLARGNYLLKLQSGLILKFIKK